MHLYYSMNSALRSYIPPRDREIQRGTTIKLAIAVMRINVDRQLNWSLRLRSWGLAITISQTRDPIHRLTHRDHSTATTRL